jgi:hypothetical protein
MRTIFKYDLMIGYNSLYLPDGYKVVHVGEQYGNLTIWVEQDATDTKHGIYCYLYVYGTGQQFFDTGAVHVGTVLMSNGLVWHVYGTK